MSAAQVRAGIKVGAVWSAVDSFGSRTVSLLLFVVLARLLSPEVFGLMAAAAVVMVLVDYITDQGLGAALVQRQDLQPAHCDTVFWAQVGGSAVAAAIGFAAAPWMAGLYERPEIIPVIRALMIGPLLGALCSVQQALLQRRLAFKAIALRRLVANVVAGAIAVALAALGAGVWSLAAQLLLGQAITAALLWRSAAWRPGREIHLWALRDLMEFSVGLFLLTGTGHLRLRLEHFIIGVYLGPAALGMYSMAQRIVRSVSALVISPMSRLGLPMFSRLRDAPSARRRAYESHVMAAVTFGFPAAVGLHVVGARLSALLLGPQWLEVEPLLRVLAVLLVVRALATADGGVILSQGRLILRAGIVAVFTMATLATMWAYVDRGLLAVATVGAAASLAFLPVNYVVVWPDLGIRAGAYLRILVPPVLGSAAMAGAMWMVEAPLAARAPETVILIAKVAAGLGAYTGLIWILSPAVRSLALAAIVMVRRRLAMSLGL